MINNIKTEYERLLELLNQQQQIDKEWNEASESSTNKN